MTANINNLPRTIWWDIDSDSAIAGVYLIDQSRLPLQGDVLCCHTLEGVEIAIQSMALRGAPALGVAAAMSLALYSENESKATETEEWLTELAIAAARISAARPTAVNLSWGADQALNFARLQVERGTSLADAKVALVEFAKQLAVDDETANRAIGTNGAALLMPGSNVMTICNAGSLATAYYGTALGVIYSAYDQGRLRHVWVTETRPVNQGARLTAWELSCAGVAYALITDSMAATVMSQGWVDAILVGADRIASNGDTANKIGTLSLAVLAKHFAIPFYVCAPESTIDRAIIDGSQITIEQRDPRELTGFTASGVLLPDDADSLAAYDKLTESGPRSIKFKAGHAMQLERKGGAYAFDAWFATTPPNTEVYNPAFDITPAKLITKIITEEGVFSPNNLV